MKDFDLRKYLAENKLLKEAIDFPEMEDEFEGAMDAMVVEPEVYLQDIIDASSEEIVSDDYYEIMNAVEQGVYSAEEAVKLAKAWAQDKLSGLAENKLLKEEIDYSSIKDEMKKMYDIDVDLDTIEYFVTSYDDGEGMDVFDTTEREDFYLYLTDLAEGRLLKENDNDGSQYHIEQIDDDITYGQFNTPEDVDTYLDNIIKGIERLRIEKKEAVRASNFGNRGIEEIETVPQHSGYQPSLEDEKPYIDDLNLKDLYDIKKRFEKAGKSDGNNEVQAYINSRIEKLEAQQEYYDSKIGIWQHGVDKLSPEDLNILVAAQKDGIIHNAGTDGKVDMVISYNSGDIDIENLLKSIEKDPDYS